MNDIHRQILLICNLLLLRKVYQVNKVSYSRTVYFLVQYLSLTCSTCVTNVSATKETVFILHFLDVLSQTWEVAHYHLNIHKEKFFFERQYNQSRRTK